MAGKSTRVTLQDISDKTGYGRSTVSLALRDHPSIKESTRKKIRSEAEKLGYRPNPLVSVLMAQLKGKHKDYRETIAVLVKTAYVAEQMTSASPFYGMLYDSIKKKAAEQGFSVDLFCADELGVSASRLSRIFLSRGIHGVLIFPGGSTASGERLDIQLDWQYFVSVLVGFNGNYQELNQVVPDYTYDVNIAIEMLHRSNRERVGFAIPKSRNRGSDYNWMARFLLYQRELPVRRRIPFVPEKGSDFGKEEFLVWFQKHTPDTLLVAGDEVRNWLEEAGVSIPDDVRLINLVKRGEAGLAGIDPQTSEVGGAAVELLISLLQSNQYGIPQYPRTIAVKGAWNPGKSFPEHS
ncbi:LacI family DNA-binding transcriptional regulator [Puniceicoccus vermicola]|uniref:LacI family DNA-binding transcriptional regulator n=1 Tax=Puniceicoccus vermicola TaxID=388746 RepID=A0A7X1AZF1_9BACT|nr:LacI family DNA-binding transcriptional regulator [Puniceicoccus vermicola]MBC2602732.1 LacI family DNA-binding transcriptional regulator [Puniceicoccus vermicola]